MASRVPAIFDIQDACSPLSVPNHQTALLLLDYQNVTVSLMGDAATRAISVARTLQKWASDNKIVVIHCLIDAKSGENPKPSAKAAGRWKVMQEMLQATPYLADEHEGLANISLEEKTDARRPGYVSALQGPKLREMLDTASVKSLILGGISTSGCVLSTCRAATDAGYIVTVIDDACADTVDGLHDLLVKHVLSSTAHIATAAELMEVWKTKDLKEEEPSKERERTS